MPGRGRFPEDTHGTGRCVNGSGSEARKDAYQRQASANPYIPLKLQTTDEESDMDSRIAGDTGSTYQSKSAPKKFTMRAPSVASALCKPIDEEIED